MKRYLAYSLIVLLTGALVSVTTTRAGTAKPRDVKLAEQTLLVYSSDGLVVDEIPANSFVYCFGESGDRTLIQKNPELWVDSNGVGDVCFSEVTPKYVITIRDTTLHDAYREIEIEQGESFVVDRETTYTYAVMFDDEEWFLDKCDCYEYTVNSVYKFVDEISEGVEAISGNSVEITLDLESLHNAVDSLRCADVVSYARQFIGNPYVWGGTDLVRGADCSGFVQSVYKQFGIFLPRTAAEQACVGIEVSKGNAVAGDLLFFYNNSRGKIGHVAIYEGNDTMIEAKGSKYGIVESCVCWDNVCCIRKVR